MPECQPPCSGQNSSSGGVSFVGGVVMGSGVIAASREGPPDGGDRLEVGVATSVEVTELGGCENVTSKNNCSRSAPTRTRRVKNWLMRSGSDLDFDVRSK